MTLEDGKCMQCGEEIPSAEPVESDYKAFCDDCMNDIDRLLIDQPPLSAGTRVRVYMSDPVRGVAVRNATVELPGESHSATKGEPVVWVCLDHPISLFDTEEGFVDYSRFWVHRKQVRLLKKKSK